MTEKRKQSPADSVLQTLSSPKMKSAIKAVIPKFMTLDRFFQMAVAAAKVQANSKYVVNKASIITCVYSAAKYGLELNEQLGHAYLVPFKKTCTLIVGYKGLLELVRRSGKVSDIYAFMVYENDKFDYWVDEHGPHITYKPELHKERGKPICGVSIARFTDEKMKPSIDVMPIERIDAIGRAALQRTPKSPWGVKLYKEEMQKKTVLRHHCKTLPMSVEAAEVIDMDEKVERDEMPMLEMPDELKSEMENIEEGQYTENPDEADNESNEEPERTKKQLYNITLAKVVRKLGSEGAQEAIDEVAGKTLPENKSIKDLGENDILWDALASNLSTYIKEE